MLMEAQRVKESLSSTLAQFNPSHSSEVTAGGFCTVWTDHVVVIVKQHSISSLMVGIKLKSLS